MLGYGPGLGSLFSGSTLLFWMVAIVIGWFVLRTRRNYVSGTLMVLKRFHIDDSPSARVIVEMDGRASGIISWLLTLLKLKPDLKFAVTNSEVIIHSASLSGTQVTYIPIGKITASVCGYQRSIVAFGFATLFICGFVMQLWSGLLDSAVSANAVVGDIIAAIAFLILAGISGLVYYLSKKISIAVESMHSHGVIFKRSVIENVTVDLPEALRVAALINKQILAAQTVGAIAGVPDASPSQLSAMAAAPSNDHRVNGHTKPL